MDWDNEYMQSKLQRRKQIMKNKYKIGQPVKTKHGCYTKIMGLFYEEGLTSWRYYIHNRSAPFDEVELFELSHEEKNTYYY